MVSSPVDSLEGVCGEVLRESAGRLPLRNLRACADVSDRGTAALTAAELQLRAGPYPHYRRGYEQALLDDYTFTGRRLLVGAKGAVAAREGRLLVVDAHGRFSASDLFHVIHAAEGDADYLYAVLSAVEAGRLAKGTPAAPFIELSALRSLVVPWPECAARQRVARVFAECVAEGCAEQGRRVLGDWMAAAREQGVLEYPCESAAAANGDGRGGENGAGRDGGEGVLALVEGLLDALGCADEAPVDVVAATRDLVDCQVPATGGLCICFPPANQGPWTQAPVREDDPRWIFGPPPRNKANYAWIQQAAACMAERGSALLLLGNAALHTDIGREGDVRRACAGSGLVAAVVALPGGLFADGRPPQSLMVLEKGRVSDEVLFIDAQQLGDEVRLTERGTWERRLSGEAAARIATAFSAWRNGKGYQDESGFCAAVPLDCVRKSDGLLTPWTYVCQAAERP